MKFAKDVFAGTCGGITVTLLGHPFDTVKVLLQTQSSKNPVYSGGGGRGEQGDQGGGRGGVVSWGDVAARGTDVLPGDAVFCVRAREGIRGGRLRRTR